MSYSAAAAEKDPRPLWSRLAERFPNEKEHLATYVALETAEVLAEAKPASLLSIPNRERACGRNLNSIWKEHGHELLADTPLHAKNSYYTYTDKDCHYQKTVHISRIGKEGNA